MKFSSESIEFKLEPNNLQLQLKISFTTEWTEPKLGWICLILVKFSSKLIEFILESGKLQSPSEISFTIEWNDSKSTSIYLIQMKFSSESFDSLEISNSNQTNCSRHSKFHFQSIQFRSTPIFKKNRRFNWYLNYSTAKNEKN